MSLSRLPRTLPWITVVTVLFVRSGAAENWPGFRGPTGQGISHEKNLPLTWSLAENVAWRVEISGIGWSFSGTSKCSGRNHLARWLRTPMQPPRP